MPVLEAVAAAGAPVFVHPGPAGGSPVEPAWWSPSTRYVAQQHAAWHAFHLVVRPALPSLRAVFALRRARAAARGTRRGARRPRRPRSPRGSAQLLRHLFVRPARGAGDRDRRGHRPARPRERLPGGPARARLRRRGLRPGFRGAGARRRGLARARIWVGPGMTALASAALRETLPRHRLPRPRRERRGDRRARGSGHRGAPCLRRDGRLAAERRRHRDDRKRGDPPGATRRARAGRDAPCILSTSRPCRHLRGGRRRLVASPLPIPRPAARSGGMTPER